MKAVEAEEGSTFMAVSVNTFVIGLGVLVLTVLVSLPAVYWCYRRKCKWMKQAARREVFHGLEVSDHSDREFQDSDDTEHDVEEHRAIYVD